MSAILLSTLNASWQHVSFGLRYLLANLGGLQPDAEICEFTINQRTLDMVEVILAREPRIVGFGVYVWNATETTRLVSALKRLRPELIVIVGGPEVSYETEQQEIAALADAVITGEADLTFPEVCRQFLAGRPPREKIIPARLPQPAELALPYSLYDEEDLKNRFVYVEASRGCPFSCEFCLSSLDIPVRAFDLERLLPEFDSLLHRGTRHFKFVDRTFNLNVRTSRAILEFFRDRWRPDLFLHFEMIPDRLPVELREVIASFPAGAVQFEVGVQTLNPVVAANVSRRNDLRKLEENLAFLRRETNVHVHADLIAGLPGETLASFAAGFDRLVAMGPQEIQVGILKRLRGTPIVRHDAAHRMRYAAHPPCEVLETSTLTFAELQHLRRFAKYWDLLANSGNFLETTRLLWSGADGSGPFSAFSRLTRFLWERLRRTDGIAQMVLVESLFAFLTDVAGQDRAVAAQALWRDLTRHRWPGRPPAFLAPFLSEDQLRPVAERPTAAACAERQARHAGKMR